MISVVIVSRRLEKLKGCIISLLNQSYQNFEIIIIWNGNIDNLNKLKNLNKLDKNKNRIKIITDGSNNVSRGRNLGIKNSVGQFIAFTDDDCEAAKYWLEYLLNKLVNNSTLAGTGSIRDVKNTYNRLAVLWGLAYIKVGNLDIKYQSFNDNNIYLCTSSALFRKQILIQLDGFDENLTSGEDSDLSHRIKTQGYFLQLEPKAYLSHYHPETWKGMIKQQVWYGYGDYQLTRKNNYKIMNSILQKIVYLKNKFFDAFSFSLKKRDIKLLFIFPVYVLTMESARLLGYSKGIYQHITKTNIKYL